MNTVKIDRSATSQSVRLPDGFQFDVDEVEIFRRGDEVILRKKMKNLREAFDLLASMPDDFFAEGRQDPPPEVHRKERTESSRATISLRIAPQRKDGSEY